MSTERPSWETYFMDITALVAKRTTCLRRGVGAVIVKDKRILATGYNGAPSGIRHCAETGCLREKLNVPSGMRHELCRGIHAEQNAIIQAAYHGVSIKGADLFCTNQPCSICAKMIVNAGIVRIFYRSGYADELALEMLSEAHIEMIQTAGSDDGEGRMPTNEGLRQPDLPIPGRDDPASLPRGVRCCEEPVAAEREKG